MANQTLRKQQKEGVDISVQTETKENVEDEKEADAMGTFCRFFNSLNRVMP